MNSYIVALLLLCQFSCKQASEVSQAPQLTGNQQKQKNDKAGIANIVLKSTDGGQSWQDISAGLPKAVQDNYDVGSDGFFADNGMYLAAGAGIYSTPNANVAFWNKEMSGETRKPVNTASGGKLVEYNGVLLATSNRGIIRSTDDGETWETVISEGGVGIDVQRIDGGFAAITFNTQLETRRVRTSYDGGKTWQAIDADLPPSMQISSIIQVGNYFFCGHPNGIYRSGDKGTTWQLILPSIEGKVFNLSVSGNVIYAVPSKGGC